MSSTDTHALLWFRRQLRIHDQPLFEGIDRANTKAIGIWILDPREYLSDEHGFTRAGTHRIRFLLEAVADLRTSMRRLGSDLLFRVGHPEEILPQLVKALAIDEVQWVEEPGTEERAIERAVSKSIPVKCVSIPPETLFALDDPRQTARELPEVFSSFRRTSEKHRECLAPFPTPTQLHPIHIPADVDLGDIPTLHELDIEDTPIDSRAVLQFKGGESHGLKRLQSWMYDGDHLRKYKITRNGMLGEEYSSKFSPWISIGALSPRRIVHETLRYESERVANDSTYWLRFELFWREYFRLYLLKHGRQLFLRKGPAQLDLHFRNDVTMFDAWRHGHTGVPLIDANMRELHATGFMSNRGRQIVASFLVKNLDIDWRWGAQWFEHCLIDYCPAANWGNWAYAAGVGADPRGFRGFDITRQARNYDGNGDYVAHWLPQELAGIQGIQRHTPWTSGGASPIVSLDRSMDAAQNRWEAAHHSSHR